MNVYDLTTKNWVKVRLNKGSKTFSLTQQTFKTKTEGEKHLGKSDRFVIMNKKALLKLMDEDWLDAEIEKQCEEYAKRKMESDIAKYTEEKTKRDIISNFLNTPNYVTPDHSKWNGHGVEVK